MSPNDGLSRDMRDWLTRQGGLADGHLDPMETLIRIAGLERPGALLDPYRRHLEKLTREVTLYAGGPMARIAALDLRVEALREVLARRHGYSGDEDGYADPGAADMMRLIDQRRGLPVMLGILYIHTAKAVGWAADGLGLPGRFLVRLDDGKSRVIVDPFDGGRVLAPRDVRRRVKETAGNEVELAPEQFEAMGNHDIVLRAIDNAKVALLKAERTAEALSRIQMMLLLSPGGADLWRQAGLLNARLENIAEAVAALEEFLRLDTGGGNGYGTSKVLQDLRARLD